MPDTGSPWNIPYVEAADLVRDWPADSLLVANAVAAGLSAANNAGIGSNVQYFENTTNFTTTSTSMADVTGATVSITLSSASSKVFLICNSRFISSQTTANRFVDVQIADGSDVQVAIQRHTPSVVGRNQPPAAIVALATPGSVGPHTYKVRIRTQNADAPAEIDSVRLIAIEVAA